MKKSEKCARSCIYEKKVVILHPNNNNQIDTHMKRTIFWAAILFCALTMSVTAQAKSNGYTHSVGATVGNLYGAEYKGFIFGVDGLALQVDLGCKISNWGNAYTLHWVDGPVSGTTHYPTKGRNVSMDYFTFEVNPNIVYNLPIHSGKYGTLAFCAGGGISMGVLKYGVHNKWTDKKGNKHSSWWAFSHSYKDNNGKTRPYVKPGFKFGLNALAGIEMNLKAAPVILALDFRPGLGVGYTTNTLVSDKETVSFFDWTLALAVRYRF